METVVIAGGGVAGLDLATRLGRTRGAARRVILVDSAPTHFWKPLLHSVAAGLIDPAHYHIDYARQAMESGFEFVCGEIVGIDRASRSLQVRLRRPREDDGVATVHYDRLVLSFGSVTNFFGVPGARQHCLSLDSVGQAEAFRQRFLNACAATGARRDAFHDAGLRDTNAPLVDIVIVGAGPTGIELAADLRHTVDTLVKYRLSGLGASRQVRIRLLERGQRLLPGLDPAVSALAVRKLRGLGIELCTRAAVSEVGPHEVRTEDGRVFPAALTVWAAGVRGPQLAIAPALGANRNGQILVDEQLQTVDDPRVYAMGDCSSLVQPDRSQMIPPTAQAARQQSAFLAGLLTRRPGAAPPRFAYRDYGTLVTLGRSGTVGILLRAVGKRNLRVRGAIASLMYRMTYERYVMSHVGLPRMLGHMVARWCRSKMLMPVKWH
ncbi:NAD(P)/FAD-dependent oxidoreductase [Massilia sp. DD77]|uniref:NAD(P)/FAD-dependent oxidoreductase n=1 Tax=Massilia sp. DD77 TaxID=3109349 RepID=UPI002FFEE2A2